ncbi:Glutamate synthase [NADPH] large chain precursor [Aquimixticola soesokkakensis]|uniref:Glutamate synthase [NADPH] large chain n=1 Tax=Aquimixticola soesokkakensis TaxID=1519096 RepID=A0A1Y5TLS6_9RHOB|nr:FMN-binding glutamate synthase family protein [Aquimixticola soesokkakensis]SLN63347.1 Glutamate synthase [NADPH] large chain precursor [Aquimixticola soesokkakensis]
MFHTIHRFSAFALIGLLTGAALALSPHSLEARIILALGTCLCALGVYDLIQRKHAVLRNYPVIGHMRYLLESIRPELRQYFFENDEDEEPFSRDARTLIYQRAKDLESSKPFGTKKRVYDAGYEWLTHSIRPRHIADKDFRVTIGGPACKQPYAASVYNISAMSYGALSGNAIVALNRGAKAGGFAHDTGEGGVSAFHHQGGDLIWEIGSGYFGCRTENGRFDADAFAQTARNPQIKMIEVKLSQGAKPGLGGVLPAAKITAEIARARGVPMGVDCISPPSHSAFSTPLELMEFLGQLRDLSGGKPVGFKLCIGHRREFMCLVKAMLATNFYPDFIVVDGKEGGTGAAPLEFANHMGMPLVEGLTFVHNTLRGAGIRDDIRIGASGKLTSAFDIAKAMALGADWANSARGYMFALGCIQSQSCHTNRCPVGIATQDTLRARALNVPDKAQRVANFHANTLAALAEITGAAGLVHPNDFRPHHIMLREKDRNMVVGNQVYKELPHGFLIAGHDEGDGYLSRWNRADPASFYPNDDGV